MQRESSGKLGCVIARAGTALLAGLCWTATGAAQTLDQLYALAKGETTVALWGAGPATAYERTAREFEQRFPGLTVSYTGGFSNVLNARIEEQLSAKKVETDVAVLQTIQNFIDWGRRGLLLPFRPDGFERIDPPYKSRDGAWIAVSKVPILYGYNIDQVQQDVLPQLATEFLRPQFRGKLISAYPSDDDASLFAFATIIQKYGWGYMDQYMKQVPKFIQGHLGVARSIGSGESAATFDMTAISAVEVRRAGGKIALAGPNDDYVPIFFLAEAILKDAPHPNAAKLFVAWYLSKDYQSRTELYSPRNDVPAPAGLPSLSNFRLEERYGDFVNNRAEVADLRARLERYTGPVKNTGDVR